MSIVMTISMIMKIRLMKYNAIKQYSINSILMKIIMKII